MTESEWLACGDPKLMLECLRDSGDPSERKLRLFAAACCRRAWQLLDSHGRAVVELSERVADGLADEAEVKGAVYANCCQDIDVRAAVDYAALGGWRPAVTLLAAVCARPSDSVSAPEDSAV